MGGIGRIWVGVAMAIVASGVVIGPASAENVVRTSTPGADTFVASSAPNTSYGTIKQLEADSSPTKVALLRFPVAGVGSGEVVRATLRLFVTDASPVGGTVQAVAGPWTEATTWSTRPGLGIAIAEVGPVAKGNWVEVDVTAAVAADGDVALAISSTNSDAAGYASRQSSNPPQLLVEVGPADEPPPPPPPPGEEPTLSTVADPLEGSSAPTAYANSHRLARTAAGRELAVFGRHGLGVQLSWRDGNGAWSHVTRGGALDGMLITSTGTGDWPASIVVGRDSAGTPRLPATSARTPSPSRPMTGPSSRRRRRSRWRWSPTARRSPAMRRSRCPNLVARSRCRSRTPTAIR
jgi:hypothetical protein